MGSSARKAGSHRLKIALPASSWTTFLAKSTHKMNALRRKTMCTKTKKRIHVLLRLERHRTMHMTSAPKYWSSATKVSRVQSARDELTAAAKTTPGMKCSSEALNVLAVLAGASVTGTAAGAGTVDMVRTRTSDRCKTREMRHARHGQTLKDRPTASADEREVSRARCPPPPLSSSVQHSDRHSCTTLV
jgi:hypothetical protein